MERSFQADPRTGGECPLLWRAPPLRWSRNKRGLSPFSAGPTPQPPAPNPQPPVQYWGAFTEGFGQPPQWPPGRGKKIFAYVRPFPALPALLTILNSLPNPSLLYIPELDPRLRDQCRSPTVRFADAPLEMGHVARECDVAIINGTHATAAAMLLAGRPALHIPVHLEQALNAVAIERLGAGIGAQTRTATKSRARCEDYLSPTATTMPPNLSPPATTISIWTFTSSGLSNGLRNWHLVRRHPDPSLVSRTARLFRAHNSVPETFVSSSNFSSPKPTIKINRSDPFFRLTLFSVRRPDRDCSARSRRSATASLCRSSRPRAMSHRPRHCPMQVQS